MTTTSSRPPQFYAPTLSAPAATLGQPATPSKSQEAIEERVIEKLRALLRDGRGSMMITVTAGAVHYWRVLPDGRSDIG